MLSAFVEIAWFIVLPVMLLIGLGFVLQRKLGLDLPTLTRLNFYVVVPGMIYTAVVRSELTLANVGVVAGFSLGFMAVMAGLCVLAAWLRGVPRDRWSPLVMTGIFYNAGNYGLPMQQLAFRPTGQGDAAMGMQVFVMLVQNVTSFTVGIVLAAGGGLSKARMMQNLRAILRFPPIYALAAAVVTLLSERALGERADGVAGVLTPFMDTLTYAQGGFVVVALVTLGAQLATVRRGLEAGGAEIGPVTLSVALRLLVAPAVGWLIVWGLGLEGLTAQVLLLSTATPVSVNCMLICLEFDNHPDFLARSVFWSTLLSPVTVTGVILGVRAGVV